MIVSHDRRNLSMTTVYEKIKESLESHSVDFEVMNHEPVYTSEEAARVRGTPLKEGAKAMVMKANKKPVLVVLAADRRIDNKRFKKQYKVKDLRMASPEEVEELTGLKIGSIPPFGNILGLPTYVDRSLLENQRISFNAGMHTRSIIMLLRDYLETAEAQVGDFT